MELKERSKLKEEVKWDLRPVFADVSSWETAYAQAKQAVNAAGRAAGTLGRSAGSLKAGLDAVYDALEKVQRVYLYASLLKSGDNGDSRYQEMFARAMNLYVSLSAATAFVDPEILSIPEQTLEAYLSGGLLKDYRHILGDITRSRAHTLGEREELLLAKLGDAAQIPDDCFTMLESVDMRFPEVRDENGASRQLTHGSFAAFRESASPEVRRQSFEKYFGEFQKYINTWAAMYGGSVKLDSYFAEVRGFESPCQRALFSSNVPVFVYDGLVSSVRRGIPLMERYLRLRRRCLGLEELNAYDLYCPIVEDVQWKMGVEEAKALVRQAAAPLGGEYARLLDRAFSERWMDLYENKGKTTGRIFLRCLRGASLCPAQLFRSSGRRVYHGARAGTRHALLPVRRSPEFCKPRLPYPGGGGGLHRQRGAADKISFETGDGSKAPGISSQPLSGGVPHHGVPPDAVRGV